MRKTLMGLASAIILSSFGCANPQIEEGVIAQESFYPAQGLLVDRYTAIVKLSNGREVNIFEEKNDARITDLKYNAGDTVKVKRINNTRYRILDNSP
jgi:hypothetical protein